MTKRTVVIGAVLLALVAGGSFVYLSYLNAMRHVARAQQYLAQTERSLEGSAWSLLEPDRLEETRQAFGQAKHELQQAQARIGPVTKLGKLVSWVPNLGPKVTSAPKLLSAGIAISDAGKLTSDGLKPFSDTLASRPWKLFGDTGMDDRPFLALWQGKPNFEEALAQIDLATSQLQQLEDSHVQLPVALPARQLENMSNLLRTLIAAPDLASDLFAMDGPRSYLLLAQNSDELRATGGFIAGAWLLSLDKGRVAGLEFWNSPDVDDLSRQYPPPPVALFQYMRSGYWYFRDANWSPDFPTAAKMAQYLFEVGQRQKVDGVIGIDDAVIKSILDATGPVRLKGYDISVDASNALEKLQYGLEARYGTEYEANLPPRKLFMKALFQGLLERLQNGLDAKAEVKLIQNLYLALDEKHLLLYFADSQAQSLLQTNSWDGALRTANGDFLMVVDSNVGFNKINPIIDETLDYSVTLDDSGAQAKLRIKYKNNSPATGDSCVQAVRHTTYEEMQRGCYWDYLRVYVPDGSQLAGATYVPLPKGSLLYRSGASSDNQPTANRAESGKTALGNFFVVAPQQTTELAFDYRLPPAAFAPGSASYTLLVQKQPGTQAVPINISVTLPRGARVISTEPKASSIGDGVVRFKADLLQDRTFSITLAR